MGDSVRRLDPSIHGIAGAVAAQVSTITLYPIEQARFLVQVGACADEAHGHQHRCCLGSLALLSDMAAKQGLRAVYRGVGPVLLTISVSQGIYFWAYEALRSSGDAFPTPAEGQGAMQSALAALGSLAVPVALQNMMRSLLAAVVTVLLTNPLWVVTMRLKLPPPPQGKGSPRAQAKATAGAKPHAVGQSDCWLPFLPVARVLAEILEVEGAAALWQGLGSSLWLTASPTLQFLAYESLKAMDLSWRQASHPSGVEAFVMGAAAKGCALVATYPLQVVQSNLRLAGQERHSTFGALRQIQRERGISGLFAGLEAKILQTLLNGALMMLLYEKILEAVASLYT
mmetsp:Transcript_35197/g.111923  ORF Transcript_35197/g.111923 Transcript_35197/m.111923 type:complete len:342 (+) Transcript_35197:38-1063(+)